MTAFCGGVHSSYEKKVSLKVKIIRTFLASIVVFAFGLVLMALIDYFSCEFGALGGVLLTLPASALLYFGACKVPQYFLIYKAKKWRVRHPEACVIQLVL